jgi:phosphoglycolate phosphatase-like HAD superfamily hydrolase
MIKNSKPFHDFMQKAIIFDVHGTLIDDKTIPEIFSYLAKMATGKELPGNDFGKYLGIPTAEIFRNALKDNGLVDGLEAKVNRCMEEYNKHYPEEVVRKSKLLEGVKKSLPELEKEGFSIYICSYAPRVGLEKHIKKVGLSRYWKSITTQEDIDQSSTKYSPPFEKFGLFDKEVYIVEDNPIGIKEAKKTIKELGAKQVTVIAVRTGYIYKNDKELKDAGADVILDSVADLPDYFRKKKAL